MYVCVYNSPRAVLSISQDPALYCNSVPCTDKATPNTHECGQNYALRSDRELLGLQGCVFLSVANVMRLVFRALECNLLRTIFQQGIGDSCRLVVFADVYMRDLNASCTPARTYTPCKWWPVYPSLSVRVASERGSAMSYGVSRSYFSFPQAPKCLEQC